MQEIENIIELDNDDVFTALITWGDFYSEMEEKTKEHLISIGKVGLQDTVKPILKKYIKKLEFVVRQENDGMTTVYVDDLDILYKDITDYYYHDSFNCMSGIR